jgi:hypothetical protein
MHAAMALWQEVRDGVRSFAELTLFGGSRDSVGAVGLALKVENVLFSLASLLFHTRSIYI